MPGSSNLAALSSGAAPLPTRTLAGSLSGKARGPYWKGSTWPGGKLTTKPGSGPNPSAAVLVINPTVYIRKMAAIKGIAISFLISVTSSLWRPGFHRDCRCGVGVSRTGSIRRVIAIDQPLQSLYRRDGLGVVRCLSEYFARKHTGPSTGWSGPERLT